MKELLAHFEYDGNLFKLREFIARNFNDCDLIDFETEHMEFLRDQ